MRFKKVALLSGLTVLAGSIVVLPSSSVNRNTTTSEHYNKRCDTDTSGGRRAITAAAYSEKRVLPNGWRSIASTAAHRSSAIGQTA